MTGQQEQSFTVTGIDPDALPRDADPGLRTAADPQDAADLTIAPEAEDLVPTALDSALDVVDWDPADIAVLSEPIETIDFVVAGVTWDIADAGQVRDVSLRVREDEGWSDWSSLEIHDGQERPGLTRVGTEPLVSSGGDAVQVRIATVDGEAPAGLDLQVIDPGTAPTDGAVAPASPASPHLETVERVSTGDLDLAEAAEHMDRSESSASAEVQPTAPSSVTSAQAADLLKPAIVTRSQWGADEAITTDWGSPSTQLKAMYIHHTAGSNTYTRAGAYEQIRGIHRYHASTLGWGDIGYQFLVDRYGVIYEGRRGAIDAPVIGAQAGGFNTDTIGVSAMGRFDDSSAGAQPPAVMVSAMEQVLAWQAFRYGVDPTATVRLTQSGKGTARWTSGTTVTVNTILGHTTTNATECPGPYLMAQLPSIRSRVAASVDAAEKLQGQEPGIPEAPGLPAASYILSADGMQARTSWNPVPGATHYQIMYRAQPHGGGGISTQPWLAGRTTQGTSLTLSTDPGETAQFAVRAVKGTVAGPQTYLGQHTGPVSWADESAVTRNGMSLVSHAGGVGRQALVSTRAGSSFTVRQASGATALTLSAQVPSGDARVEIVRGNRVVGGMRFQAGGPSVCTLPIARAGDDIRVQAVDSDRIEFTAVAIPRAGQSSHAPTTSTPCQVSFVDNPYGSQYFDAVHWLQWSGISAGYAGDNTFRKGRAISRGESLAFIHRYVAPEATGGTQSPFRDVPATHSFFDAVSWAVQEGIARGYADGTYRPSQSVTRAEFASLFHRTVGTSGQDASAVAFPDVSRDSSHREAILWMASQGLITGYADGTFRPDRQITRGEVAVIMHRYASTTGIGI